MEIDYRTLLNCIDDLLNDLKNKRRNIESSFEIFGQENVQAIDYRTNEPLWEDDEHTIPKYRKYWDYVPKPELTKDEKLQVNTIKMLEKEIMKLIGKVVR